MELRFQAGLRGRRACQGIQDVEPPPFILSGCEQDPQCTAGFMIVQQRFQEKNPSSQRRFRTCGIVAAINVNYTQKKKAKLMLKTLRNDVI